MTWPLTSLYRSRFCSPRNFRTPAQNDFCNSIGPSPTSHDVSLASVERVIFDRYKVTITGSVPMQSTSGETKLQFRIKGEIDKLAVRLKAADRSRWNDPNRISPEGWALGNTLSRGHHEATV